MSGSNPRTEQRDGAQQQYRARGNLPRRESSIGCRSRLSATVAFVTNWPMHPTRPSAATDRTLLVPVQIVPVVLAILPQPRSSWPSSRRADARATAGEPVVPRASPRVAPIRDRASARCEERFPAIQPRSAWPRGPFQSPLGPWPPLPSGDALWVGRAPLGYER